MFHFHDIFEYLYIFKSSIIIFYNHPFPWYFSIQRFWKVPPFVTWGLGPTGWWGCHGQDINNCAWAIWAMAVMALVGAEVMLVYYGLLWFTSFVLCDGLLRLFYVMVYFVCFMWWFKWWFKWWFTSFVLCDGWNDGLNDGLLCLLVGFMWLNNIFKSVLCD